MLLWKLEGQGASGGTLGEGPSWLAKDRRLAVFTCWEEKGLLWCVFYF